VKTDLGADDMPSADDSSDPPGLPDDLPASVEEWWHQPWKLLVLGAALVFLGVAAGYALFGGGGSPKKMNAVDVGFLQDMHTHHDQAVTTSFIYLDEPAAGQDPVLRSIAKTILEEQQFENGYMVGLLLDAGQQPANETGQVMAWMNEPLPTDRMPGLATQDELDQLQKATGSAADRLYAELMIAHHEGGIHMADYAAQHAARADVRGLAARMVTGQKGDIVELQDALARSKA
jgi:uncharacterized protein (DUF305 family)